MRPLSGLPGRCRALGRYFLPAANVDCVALFFNDCAADRFFYGKWFTEFDFKFVKKFNLTSKMTFDLNVELYNAFTSINFTQTIAPSNSANVFRITSQASGPRRGQLVFRLNF